MVDNWSIVMLYLSLFLYRIGYRNHITTAYMNRTECEHTVIIITTSSLEPSYISIKNTIIETVTRLERHDLYKYESYIHSQLPKVVCYVTIYSLKEQKGKVVARNASFSEPYFLTNSHNIPDEKAINISPAVKLRVKCGYTPFCCYTFNVLLC